MKNWSLVTVLLLLTGCVSVEDTQMEKFYAKNEIREKIYRFEEEIEYPLLPPQKKEKEKYPWEKEAQVKLDPVAVSDFICKGSKKHPNRIIVRASQEELSYEDCGGKEEHGTPTIYPILPRLLNRVQELTGRRVVITSGFRCPKHEQYLHPGEVAPSSLYTHGAACDFYVEGLQNSPQIVIKIIQDFYKQDPATSHDPSFTVFHRLPLDTSHAVTPWINREICLIINTDQEGRNPDNAHDFPYISLLVHYDREAKKPIKTTWQGIFPPSSSSFTEY